MKHMFLSNSLCLGITSLDSAVNINITPSTLGFTESYQIQGASQKAYYWQKVGTMHAPHSAKWCASQSTGNI